MSKTILQINLGEMDNTCFVAMPFSLFFQTQYTQVIQSALKDLNIECIRGDEIYSKQRIMDDIWHSIRRCRFVIAELSGRNPNVLYEIGLAHAIGKPIIILTRNADDVPFDLKDLRYLFYDVNDPFWGENLKKGIKNLILKVIENPEIGTYLEGISFPSKIDYPKIPKSKKSITKEIKPIFEVSGTWIGKHPNPDAETSSITLNLTQKGLELFGTLVNSYLKGGKQTVVQEVMNGSLEGNIIKLVAVNYTFIERGNALFYGLDTYILNYDGEKEKLIGQLIDEVGFETPLELMRLTTANESSADNAGGFRKVAFTKPTNIKGKQR